MAKKKIHKSVELELSIMQNFETIINNTDQKAQFTLTVGGILLASITIFSTGMRLDTYLGIFSVLMIGALAISIFFSLMVVIPRFPSGTIPKNIFFFGSIVQFTEKKFLAEYDELLEDAKPMLLSELYILSTILEKKMKNVQLSYIFLGISIVFWILGQILSLVN